MRGLVGPALASLILAVGLGTTGARAQVAPTPPGTLITNTAQASFSRVAGVPESRSSNVVTTTVLAAHIQSEIELLRVVDAPTASAKALIIGPTSCRPAAATGAAPMPTARLAPLTKATLLEVEHATVFRDGDPVLVRVTDNDQNHDPNAIDTIVIEITAQSTGDLEHLVLTETGLSTGVFTGVVGTAIGAAASGDCVLQVTRASRVVARYDDPVDSDSSIATALVDPRGFVFNSLTGAPIQGARLTLIDAASGQPAVVYGDDGTSAYPSQVISGAPVTDAGGTTYSFAPGAYRFPVVAHTGSYRLRVEPPAGYVFPSAADPATLPNLPGGPYTLAGGSFGQPYEVDLAAAAAVDIPVDPAVGTLVVTKSVSQPSVIIGDALEYIVGVRNAGALPSRAVSVVDRLPAGFRYVPGSAHLGEGPLRSALPDPAVDASGQALTFALGDITTGGSVALHYVTRVGAGARPGIATNRALASVGGVPSNTAEAGVLVTSDLFRDRGFIAGRVTGGTCDAGGAGIGGVRLYLEDGRTVVTDHEGRYHLEDLRAGTHVVQIDPTTLPRGARTLDCADRASRADGRSRLVDLRGGALARADFAVDVSAVVKGRDAAPADLPRAPGATEGEGALLEALPPMDTLVAGRELLLPSAGFMPAIPAMHLAVKHAPTDTVTVTVNGAPVPPVTRDHTLYDAKRTLAISRWRGVTLEEGDNRVVAVIVDAQGREVARIERAIRYGGPPVRAEVDTAHSLLVADGRTRPVVALRLYDRTGSPARPGMQGHFRLESPYRAWAEVQALQDNPLGALQPRDNVYQIGSDGIARIELEPTSTAGTAVLRLNFGERREQELRAWLEPAARDFILVGLAEGTTGYRAVADHASALPADAAEEGFEKDGRVAFFAKGQVLGSYLMTLAYDSDRSRASLQTRLQGVIDPHRYYTLYGDAAEMHDDAPSIRKLYFKLERRQFIALFGDFDTGFTVTELARYSRKLNGVRVEAGAGAVRAIAFAARTAEQAGRDVLGGDGTSGPYRLASGGLVPGGDTVRIEVRDRFRSEVVVSSTPLTRYLDYDIDYVAGTIYFNHPVASRDEFANPVYVVAEYEIAGNGAEHTTAGARASFKALQGRLEGGATLISEGAPGGERRLEAIDMRLHVGEVSQLRAEAARSQSADPTRPADGNAFLVEASTAGDRIEGRAYLRDQGAGFGLGQQALTEVATRKFGIEGRERLGGPWTLKAQAYEQQALDRDAARSFGEAELRWEEGRRLAGVGVRAVRDVRDGSSARSDQLFGNLARDVLGGRVVLKGTIETALGGHDGSAEFPDRMRVGADYRLSRQYTLFTSYERSHGANGSSDLARLGVKAEPWAGAQLESAINESVGENGSRLYSNLGLAQGFRVSQKLALDVGVERATTLSGVVAQPIAGPLFSTAPLTDFSAGFAGATYRGKGWMWVSRIERRTGVTEDRSLLSLAGYREVRAGQAFSLALHYVDSTTPTSRTLTADTRLSWAYRPSESRLMVLDRLDFIRDETNGLRSLRLVDNSHVNFELDRKTQVGFQLGLRLGHQTLSGDLYSGTSVLVGGDLRHDLDARWDLGGQFTVFDSIATHTREYSAGVDVGRRFGRQLWVSVGYNLAGFSDRDFSRDRYTAQGPYVRFRVHLDEGSLRELLDGFRAGNRR